MALKPMLAQSISLADLDRYVTDDGWMFQIKADGDRVLIEVDDGQVQVYNRQGLPRTKRIDYRIMAELGRLRSRYVLDGELVGDRLVLFDMVSAGATVVAPGDSFQLRHHALSVLLGDWNPDHITLLPVARSTEEKLLLVKQARDEQCEGIILRKRTGKYQAGRRSPGLLKAKFCRELDAIVTGLGADGHDNVVLSLLDPDNNRVVEIGRASALGKTPRPALGQVWEVRYLGLYDEANPRLAQPRLMRLRTDKDMSECLVSQMTGAFLDRTAVFRNRSNE